MSSHVMVDNEFKNVCRICLCEVKFKDCVDLFSNEREANEILTTIKLCFQVSLVANKYLPCIICSVCVSELHIANNFRIKCVTLDERFASYCSQIAGIKIDADNTVSLNNDQLESSENEGDSNFQIETGLHVIATDETCTLNVYGNSKKTECSLKVIESKKLDTFTCKSCDRSFKRKKSLLKHASMHEKRRHVGKVTGYGATRRYHCTKCNYSTPYSQTLVTHVRRHTGEKPYRCECGKCFTDLSTYNAHIRIHSSTTYFTCSTCGKQFKIAKALQQHLRSHEGGKFPCEVCHKVLKSRQTLQDHTRRHYNIRNFNCEDCGDTFVTSSELIHHKVKHKLEKNLECHLCGYKTLRRRNLIIHLKRHANDRPYKCEACEASFYSRAEVRRHQNVHTRDKAFQCPSCPKGFSRKPALNKHIETLHSVDIKWSDLKTKETVKVKLEKSSDKTNKQLVDVSTISTST